MKPKSAHKWRNYRLSLLLWLLLFYIFDERTEKKLYTIYFYFTWSTNAVSRRRRHFTKALHFCVFRLCVRFIYIFINNIRGVITVDEIYGCDKSQHYTFGWHCMRLIKWISTLTHTYIHALRSLCCCEIFSAWSHSFSFGFHSISEISRIVPLFISVCALSVCVRGKRLFLWNIRRRHTHTRNYKVGH